MTLVLPALLQDGLKSASIAESQVLAARPQAVRRPVAATTPMAPASAASSAPASQPADDWRPPRFKERQADRDRMVRVIRGYYGLKDDSILAAMAAVPRHLFVPDGLLAKAHDDSPLPIGYGQTVSQPYIVAEMTRLLDLKRGQRVLEIGTGSGYQAAVLTEFTPHVYTVEIIAPLAEQAAGRLRRLGYTTVRLRNGDGYNGWEEAAPFDAIIVTCAAGQIPPPLLRQLAPGGRMVIPVGAAFATQSLMLVEKDMDGTIRSRSLLPVAFVPMVRTAPAAR